MDKQNHTTILLLFLSPVGNFPVRSSEHQLFNLMLLRFYGFSLAVNQGKGKSLACGTEFKTSPPTVYI